MEKVILPGDKLEISENAIVGEYISKCNDNLYYSEISGKILKYSDHYSLRPNFNNIYVPQLRDLVIGRVISLKLNSWELDIGSYQSSYLNIDGLNLPGLLRVRNSADEASQRSWLCENELICAEIKKESPVMLNARSELMGKLSHGILIIAKPYEIEQLKNYYNQDQVRIIVGRNGWIWVSGEVDKETFTSCSDEREQIYSEEEVEVVGRCWQRVQELVNSGKVLTETDLYD